MVKLDSTGAGCNRIHESFVHRAEWYDVGTDVLERNRLRPREADAAAIDPLLQSLWPAANMAVGKNRTLTEEEKRMLKALGYLQ